MASSLHMNSFPLFCSSPDSERVEDRTHQTQNEEMTVSAQIFSPLWNSIDIFPPNLISQPATLNRTVSISGMTKECLKGVISPQGGQEGNLE